MKMTENKAAARSIFGRMKIRTKITLLVASVLLLAFFICGFFSIRLFMNTSIERLAEGEKEKMLISIWALEQAGTEEELSEMAELARDAYFKYQFSQCFQDGYALIKNQECILNLTDYEIINTTALDNEYCIQKVSDRWLMIMQADLNYPQGFQVISVKDITNTWTDAVRQVVQYLTVFTCTLAAALIILTCIIRRMLKLLEDLQAQADAISRGDFSHKTQIRSNDELGRLSESINRMHDKIEQQIEDLHLLLGAMAHETKTPVTSIMGYADSLLHVRLKETQKEEALEAIYRSAKRLDSLSGKLLQLISLYENQDFPTEPLHIRDILQYSCMQIRRTADENHIRLIMDGGAEQNQNDFVADGDRMLLGILFDNLLTNAIKACDVGGEIRIRIKPENRSVLILDDGCGIPAQDLPHICKAFYMADKSRSRRQQGAGLGLALADRIVKAHRADMAIESEVGTGTCVTIRFPEPETAFPANDQMPLKQSASQI